MGDFLMLKYINIKECLTAQAAGNTATSSFCNLTTLHGTIGINY